MRRSRRALISITLCGIGLPASLAWWSAALAPEWARSPGVFRPNEISRRSIAPSPGQSRDAGGAGPAARLLGEGEPGKDPHTVRGRASPATPRQPAPTPASKRSSEQASITWPTLDALSVAPGSLSTGVTGSDPLAPRPLRLWHIEAGRPRPLASTVSTPDGRFDFGQLAVPIRGLWLVVTPIGVDPRSPSPLELLLPAPPSPLIALEEYEGGEVGLRFLPALHEGELLVLDEQGETLWRIQLAALPESAWSSPLFRLSRLEPGERIHVVHELSDGRRSAPRPITLTAFDHAM